MIYERLPLQFDIEKLRKQLREEIMNYKPARGPALYGWSFLSSTGSYLDGWHDGTAYLKKNMTEEELNHPSRYNGGKRTEEYSKPTELFTGYFAEMIDALRSTGLELYRARISVLDPKAGADWHRDAPDHIYCVRMHIPIVTNPDCFFETREGKVSLPADGSVNLLYVNCEHRAFNMGSTPRYFFIANVFDRVGYSKYHSSRAWEQLQKSKANSKIQPAI